MSSKEPWQLTFDDGGPENPALRDADGYIIADVYGAHHGRRIVACINACTGVPTEALQSWINPPAGQSGLPQGPWHRHLATLGAQRAKLVNLLQAFLALDDWSDESIAPDKLIMEARAALSELEAKV